MNSSSRAHLHFNESLGIIDYKRPVSYEVHEQRARTDCFQTERISKFPEVKIR